MSSLALLPKAMRQTDSNAIKPMLRPVSTTSRFVIDKLSSNAAIALCSACKHRFNYRFHRYTPATRWGLLIGDCDGCKKYTRDQVLFIHESFVANTNGRIMSGQCYSPE